MATALELLNLGRGIAAKVGLYFREVGLTEARFTLLMMVYRHEFESQVATPSELAAHAGIGRAAMTQLLDSLVEGGWIERQTHPRDRRKLAITLSPQGRSRLEGLLPDHYARIRALMEKLTRQEQAQLRELLGKVAAGLESLDE